MGEAVLLRQTFGLGSRPEGPLDEPQRLLTDREVSKIREGVRIGMRGPVMLKWIEQLLRDHDERMRLERERQR